MSKQKLIVLDTMKQDIGLNKLKSVLTTSMSEFGLAISEATTHVNYEGTLDRTHGESTMSCKFSLSKDSINDKDFLAHLSTEFTNHCQDVLRDIAINHYFDIEVISPDDINTAMVNIVVKVMRELKVKRGKVYFTIIL